MSDDLTTQRPTQRRGAYVLAAAIAVIISVAASGGATLVMEYNYAGTLSKDQRSPLNSYGLEYVPETHVIAPAIAYASGKSSGSTQDHATHVATGAGITTTLAVLRTRFAAWPLHPIGYLLMYTFPLSRMWFSIFLGWLAKAVLMRLGGAKLMTSCQPLFTGLVIGECVAVAMWLIVSLVMVSLGMEYQRVYFTP